MRPDSLPAIESVKVALFTELVNTLSEARVRVTGSSMLPAIRPHDVLTVTRCRSHELRTGEVAMFTRDGRLFAHRVIAIRRDGQLLTRGDSLPTPDAPVTSDEIVGRVTAVSRPGLGRRILRRASQLYGQRRP